MKLGIVSLGGPSTDMILKEAESLFKVAEHIDIRGIEIHVDSKGLSVLYRGKEFGDYDCLYVRGSFRYVFLQRAFTSVKNVFSYMPLEPESFTVCHDKFLTLLELQRMKIPIPTTYLAATVKSAKKILEQVSYPIIMKIPSGTHGKGVMFADSIASAKSILDTLEVFRQPYIIQEYIETEDVATDIRAFVVGDEVVAAMKRKAEESEVRANIHMGGVGIAYEVDEKVEDIAVKAAKSVNAGICAVDILPGVKGPLVMEVNVSPSVVGITEATKKNVSKKIVKYLYKKTKEFVKAKKEKGYRDILKELEAGRKGVKEIITNLDIRAGVMRLPRVVSKVTGFEDDDEVSMILRSGKLIVKRV